MQARLAADTEAAGRPEVINYPVPTTLTLKALAEQQAHIERIQVPKDAAIQVLRAENAELRASLERLAALAAHLDRWRRKYRSQVA